jgi:hypothetical protein
VRTPVGLGYLGAIQESALGAWSPLRPTPVAWTSVSAGREVAYGVHGTSGLTIDTIDEKGEIKPFVEAPTFAPELGFTKVIELPQKWVVVGVNGDENELTIVPLKQGDGGKLSPAGATGAGIYLLPPGSTAAWARGMIAARKKPGYGAWTAAPALDAKGEPDASFYVAWTEVNPPAKYTPAGVAPKKFGAKNGCGRSSRSLSDLSVDKKVHVTRFNADGKRIEDRVVPGVIFPPEDEDLRLSLIPTSYGYALNGAPYGRDGRPKGDTPKEARPTEGLLASPPLTAPPFQRVLSASYDQKQGEGLILVAEENHQVALRFDATGELLGSPIPLETSVVPPAMNQEILALAGSSWGALERSANGIQVLTGPQAGKTIALRSEQSWLLRGGRSWVLPLDDEQIEVARYIPIPPAARASLGFEEKDRSPAYLPLVARVNLKTGEASPWQPVPGWFDGEKKPRLQGVTWIGRGASGQLLFFGTNEKNQGELHQLAKNEWAKATAIGDGAEPSTAHVMSVWKDHAILFDEGNSIASWLGKGLTVQIGRRFGQSAYNRNPGPLLRPGELALTGDASAPVKVDAAVKAAYNDCPATFATGPQRLVLVCVNPPDGKTPGARVGTRVLRF